jgi:hypothetical protein
VKGTAIAFGRLIQAHMKMGSDWAAYGDYAFIDARWEIRRTELPFAFTYPALLAKITFHKRSLSSRSPEHTTAKTGLGAVSPADTSTAPQPEP